MKIIVLFNNFMPETGGYQSAKQMCDIAVDLFGEDNVSKVFLTTPKKNFRRIKSFFRLKREERVYNAEGLFDLGYKDSRFNFYYHFFRVINFFEILKVKNLLRQADFIVITGFLEMSIIRKIRNHAKFCQMFFNHAGDPNFYNSLIKSDDNSLVWDCYIDYMNQFSRILFQSELQGKFSKEIGLDYRRCYNLFPTCDEQSITNEIHRAVNPFQSGFCNIVTIGTLQERKNQELVIELASNLRSYPFRFYLIGDDEVSVSYTRKLKNMIQERGLDNVFILGHRADYIVFVKFSDVVLNVSKFEGVSRLLREALFLGKILVCTKIYGNMECVVDHENGFLCGFEVSELEEKFLLIRNLSSHKKNQFESRSKFLYEEKYSLEGYRKNLKKLFCNN